MLIQVVFQFFTLKSCFQVYVKDLFLIAVTGIFNPVLVIQGNVDIPDGFKLDTSDQGASIVRQVPRNIIIADRIGKQLVITYKYLPIIRQFVSTINRIAVAVSRLRLNL
jgi:hypothetical protein